MPKHLCNLWIKYSVTMNTIRISEPVVSPVVASIRARTPARILVGRAGTAYPTAAQLELRQDHAAALDAVHAELDLARDFGVDLVARYQLIEVRTRAASKTEFLMRPDLGRRLCDEARTEVIRHCAAGCDLQVVIGDGLSAAAVVVQVPSLLSLLRLGARLRGWSFGTPFVVRYCRVGVLNDVGDLLQPSVVVLLIGERPGLATAESLSAYMAYQPRTGHTDAERNLISNIHRRGVPSEAAAERILALAEKMRQTQTSGVTVKEDLAALTSACAAARPRLPGAAPPSAPPG
jgi:ethanolamine ammonia-lyase small subunit